MSKNNRDFFKEKKIWSKVKDELLGCYMVPYFNKILSKGNPILYVDCFAGKGKFDDGNIGSPLVALKSLKSSMEQYQGKQIMPDVHIKFIESNHSKDLKANIPDEHRNYCEIINGRFEDNIGSLLQNVKSINRKLNVFLYIDPYGIKVLNTTLFDSLPDEFATSELLLNLNSFGFIREACRLKKIVLRESKEDIFSDLEEYDNSVADSIQAMDTIAGGNYWQAIIENYAQSRTDCYEAEKNFASQYKHRLRQKYAYVLDMPIRLKCRQQPKYRMVHATNHPDGCILMADNIAKRTDHLVVDIQNKGQLSLIPQTAENEMVEDNYLMEKTKELLEEKSTATRLNAFLADFYNRYGVLCDIGRLSSGQNGSILKTLEKNDYIEVKRTPPFTKIGKPSRFWQEGKGQKLFLQKKRK